MRINYTYDTPTQEEFEILNGILLGQNLYQIQEIPMKALGISKNDVVEAMETSKDEPLYFIRITEQDNSLTIETDTIANEFFQKLTEENPWSSLETRINENTLRVHIPNTIDTDTLFSLLENQGISYLVTNPSPHQNQAFFPF